MALYSFCIVVKAIPLLAESQLLMNLNVLVQIMVRVKGLSIPHLLLQILHTVP